MSSENCSESLLTVTIVGAGAVGLVTAIALKLQGISVSVVERRASLPIDKPCGEGVMPDAVEVLRSLGVDLRGRPFSGIRYLDRGSLAAGSFPGPPGLGVRRTDLSRSLAARCRDLGIDIHLGARVELESPVPAEGRGFALSVIEPLPALPREVLRPDVLVAADGLRSRLRLQAGLTRSSHGRRFGIRRHFAVAPWCDKVEVHWHDGAEAYVTPVGAQEVGVAILFRAQSGPDSQAGPERSGAVDGPPFDRLLERFPSLRARLEGARATSPAAGVGPLRQPVRTVCSRNLFLVGDAAGYLDAITGEGMAIGFQDATALAEVLARWRRQGSSLASAARDYRRRLAAHRRLPLFMTRLALILSSQSWLRRRVLRSLERNSLLFDRLLAIHCRSAPPLRVGVPTLLRLAGSLGRGLVVRKQPS